MKLYIAVLLISVVSVKLTAQDSCLIGQTYSDYDQLDAFNTILTLDSNEFIAVGTSWNINTGYYNLFIVKTDNCGEVIWTHTHGLEQESYVATSAHYKPGDNFIMFTANYYQHITAQYFYCVTKLSLDGEILWMRNYWAGPKNSAPKSVVQTSDGGFAIVGFNQNFANDYSKIWFIKTDGEGNIEWDKYYGTDNNSEGVYQILHLPDDGYLILGSRSYSGTPTVKTWLIRTDSLGNILWQRLHGNDFATYGVCIIPIPDGYMISGIQYAAPTWQIAGDAYLLKTDINGYMQWQRTYGGQYSEQISKIMQLPDGNYMCMGSNASWGTVDSPDGWLFKVSAVGDSIWSKTYRYDTLAARSEYFYDFTTAPDGGFMIGGWAGQPAPTNQDAWIVRTDSLGNACPPYNGCWAVGTEQTPPFFEGGQGGEQVVVYPNPATHTISIHTQQPWQQLFLYNIHGQEVASYVHVSNNNTIELPQHLQNGMYIARLQLKDGNFKSVKLLISK
ncbi:MAG TPA: T9SS type A sorting domain-containing protein [Chitinophagales bacterium]|nr:T9SS type A sorting domain-containing protein [Chitinophagales bacterium]